MPGTAFLLSYHHEGDSPLERLVDSARAACVIDTAKRARDAGFARVLVEATDAAPLTGLLGPDIDLAVDPVRRPFGERMRRAARRLEAEQICYAGCGMPLLGVDDWRWLRCRAEAGETVVNNLYSTDLFAGPAAALAELPGDLDDNGLGLHLRDVAGAAVSTPERSAGWLFDIDTPADVAVASLCRSVPHFDVGAALAGVLSSQEAPGLERMEAAVDFLTARETRVLVIGRVGSAVWQALESETAARVRVISEERGLRARREREPRSLLGFHLGAVGPEELVDALSELGDAVFLDARPLWAHLDWRPSRAERFAADAGEWERIASPPLRAFVRAVGAARVPMVVGGHSLVSGGLLALIDVAWSRWEQRGGDDPD